jgi:hypothetical protein
LSTHRDEVERFLAGPIRHRLPAPGSWDDGNRAGEYRMKLPIEVEGEISQFELQLVTSPDSVEPGLRMVLRYGRAFWRLCMTAVEHPNSFNRPDDLPAMIFGPHHHSWPDNRRFGPANSLPKKLRNARLLPAHIRSDVEAFAWFLEQVKVLPPDWEMPPWPIRTRLL